MLHTSINQYIEVRAILCILFGQPHQEGCITGINNQNSQPDTYDTVYPYTKMERRATPQTGAAGRGGARSPRRTPQPGSAARGGLTMSSEKFISLKKLV
jgi:hypothetical protein